MRKLTVLAVLAACGSTDPGPGPDARVDGDSSGMHDAPSITCDPATQTGCAAGTACYSDWVLTGGDPNYTCEAPGSGTQGAACTVDTNCATGFWCVKFDKPDGTHVEQCAEYCRLNSTPRHGCSGPYTCVEGQDAPFGFCI